MSQFSSTVQSSFPVGNSKEKAIDLTDVTDEIVDVPAVENSSSVDNFTVASLSLSSDLNVVRVKSESALTAHQRSAAEQPRGSGGKFGCKDKSKDTRK